MLRYCILTSLILCAPVTAYAELLFDDSFETCVVGGGNSFPCEGWNDFNQETWGVPPGGYLDMTNEFPLSGTKTVRFTWKDGVEGGYGKPSIYKSFATPQDYIFLRVPMRRGSTWSYPANGNSKLVIVGNVETPRLMITDRFGQYQIAVECPYNVADPTTGVMGVSGLFWKTGIAPSANAWDQLELEYKLNTPGLANGIVRLWINNILRLEKLNLEMRAPAPNTTKTACPVMHSTYMLKTIQIYKQGGLGVRHYDRVAVDNAKRVGLATGTGLSQPVADTTPPTPPTSLTAQ